MYYKGFDQENFIEYIKTKYTKDEKAIATISRIIDYAQETHHISKDQFVNFLSNLIPFVDTIEILEFSDDSILSDYNIKRKQGLI